VMNYNLPPDEGKKKRSFYWRTCIVLGLIGWVFSMSGWQRAGVETGGICGGSFCCFSLIFAISALSTKNDTQRVVVVQQQPQYVPIIQQVRTPRYPPPAQVQQSRPTPQQKSPATWAAEAKNLELARNWEGAADAYQKAGMFSEAGRIRQEHLEQSQPVVQIGHVGNTVLNDSVMIAESTPKTCASCGNVSEPSWKICPHCSNPL